MLSNVRTSFRLCCCWLCLILSYILFLLLLVLHCKRLVSVPVIYYNLTCKVAVWHSGGELVSNIVNIRRAMLVLRWVTICGSSCVCLLDINQPPRLTQPGHPLGWATWVTVEAGKLTAISQLWTGVWTMEAETSASMLPHVVREKFLLLYGEAAILYCISYHYLQYLHIQQSSVSCATTLTSLLVLCSYHLDVLCETLCCCAAARPSGRCRCGWTIPWSTARQTVSHSLCSHLALIADRCTAASD